MSGHQVTLYIYKPDLESPYAVLMPAIRSMKQETSTPEDLNETISADFPPKPHPSDATPFSERRCVKVVTDIKRRDCNNQNQ